MIRQNLLPTILGGSFPAAHFLSLSGAALLLAAVTVGARDAGGHDADLLISGIGLTHLTVYDQRPAPDGLNSGSPHIHAVTDEGYYVMSGTGRLELHDLEHGFRTVDLTAGAYIQFPPGVLHRVISTDRLVILVVMGNAGLAERGDARIYFGKAVDGDPREYARLAGLPKEKGLEGALERRDASVEAYQGLLELWEKDRKAYRAELERFLDVHMKAAAGLREEFSRAVEGGPSAWAERFRDRLEALPVHRGEAGPLLHLRPTGTTLGMCGILRPVTGLEPVDRKNASDRRK